MQPSQEIVPSRSGGNTLAGPHLGSVAPVLRPWGLAAIAAPASFLKDVRALLTSLAGHDEVNAPLAGLGNKTHALATLGSHPNHPAPGAYQRVSWGLPILWEKSGF